MLDKLDQKALNRVRIALIEPDSELRSSLRHILNGAGFRNVRDYGTLDKFLENFDQEILDLLIVDAHTPGGDVCELVRNIRYNNEGKNPFLSVILTVWQSKIDDLDKLINAGADHIILKPVAPQTIFMRIEALIERRKPFVATSGYIGPDRRKDMRGDNQIPTFEVPNTLKMKAMKRDVDIVVLQAEIDRMMTSINGEMVHRLAFRLVFEAERLPELVRSSPKEIPGSLNDFKQTLLELMRRLNEVTDSQLLQMVGNMDEIHGRIDGLNPNPKDIELLRKLSRAINLGLKNADTLEALMKQVNESLARHRNVKSKS